MITRNLNHMTNDVICDNILRKFESVKSISRENLQETEFYSNIDPDYQVIDDHINFLVRDNTLQYHGDFVSLTTKGWFVLTNADKVGYVARRIEKANQETSDLETRRLFQWTTLATFIVLAGLLSYKLVLT